MLNAQLVYSSGFAGFSPYQGNARPAAAKPAGIAEQAAQEVSRPTATDEKPSEHSTRELVKDMNKAIQSINASLEFSQDEESGRTVIKLIDRETKETLRQFPSEEALAIARALEKFKGVLTPLAA